MKTMLGRFAGAATEVSGSAAMSAAVRRRVWMMFMCKAD
jgi:hypothetical protein